MKIVNGLVFCPSGRLRRMNLTVENGRIASIENPEQAAVPISPECFDASGMLVIPGLVDIHIHGALGADFSDGDEASVHTIARFLAENGVTGFLGTTMSLDRRLLSQIMTVAQAPCAHPRPMESRLLGVNLEGPFLSPDKCGAQNKNFLCAPDSTLFRLLQRQSGGNIRLLDIAPELPGALSLIAEAASSSCSVSLAHTCADYDTAIAAFQNGANHVTHLFNAMPPFSHRAPGVIGAAADSAAYVELISDGVHLHPAAVRAAFRWFGPKRICLISDSMRACGMPDGEYTLGGQQVIVQKGKATLPGGAIAGSVVTLSECFKRAVSFGVPLEQALAAATINPARSIGMEHIAGSLLPGRDADIVVLTSALTVHAVWRAGIRIR